MTLSSLDISLYAFALFVLFLTPGPVFIAMFARALSGGFRETWPLALGVVVGDVLWPLLAIIGVTWVITVFGGFLLVLKWVAVFMFLIMGTLLLKNADKALSEDSRLMARGILPGFIAGLVVIIGNPKAILFYMGVLPGFFDLGALTWIDITIICAISAAVPFIGNIIIGLTVGRLRSAVTGPIAAKRLNLISGGLMICVSAVIALT